MGALSGAQLREAGPARTDDLASRGAQVLAPLDQAQQRVGEIGVRRRFEEDAFFAGIAGAKTQEDGLRRLSQALRGHLAALIGEGQHIGLRRSFRVADVDECEIGVVPVAADGHRFFHVSEAHTAPFTGEPAPRAEVRRQHLGQHGAFAVQEELLPAAAHHA